MAIKRLEDGGDGRQIQLAPQPQHEQRAVVLDVDVASRWLHGEQNRA
jgi:hypothetical protein